MECSFTNTKGCARNTPSWVVTAWRGHRLSATEGKRAFAGGLQRRAERDPDGGEEPDQPSWERGARIDPGAAEFAGGGEFIEIEGAWQRRAPTKHRDDMLNG